MASICLCPRILAGQSLSEPFYIGAGQILGILIPSGWDAAAITWQGSWNDMRYWDIYTSAGFEVVTQTVAGKITAITGPAMPFTRIRSGTGGAPVTQSADRTLEVYVVEK